MNEFGTETKKEQLSDDMTGNDPFLTETQASAEADDYEPIVAAPEITAAEQEAASVESVCGCSILCDSEEIPEEPAAETEVACEEDGSSVNNTQIAHETALLNDEDQRVNVSYISEEQLMSALESSNEAILTELGKVNSSISDVNARVTSLRKLADMHEDIERELNSQINEYKDNFYRRIVNPILIEFFDIQEDMAIDLKNADENAKPLIQGYIDSITKLFRHYGVIVETASEGDDYDPRIHKPVSAVETNNIELDKKIAKTRKSLVHSIDGKVVERAIVSVYQYREPVSVPDEGKEIIEAEGGAV